jgi:hypothetical protein
MHHRQTQIDADQRVRRRKVKWTRPISSPETVGDDWDNSATAQAIRRHGRKGGLELDAGARKEKIATQWAGPGRVGLVQPTGFTTTGGPRGKMDFSQFSSKNRNFEINS